MIFLRPEYSEVIANTLLSIIMRAINLSQEINDRGRTGGYFCVASANDPEGYYIQGISLVGYIRLEKRERYFLFAEEKARRLFNHPEHKSSFQSRNDTEERYPGAIRTPQHIFSFSGLMWELDEAAMLVLAIKLRELSLEEAREIAQISENLYFEALFNVCEDILLVA